jgi:Immunity protein 21
MGRAYRWIATTGGPHVLIAEEVVRHWRGIEGWYDHRDPNDQSDYARACRVTGWLGSIRCGQGTALVLSGDSGDIAWFPNDRDDGGHLVQWIGVDDESLIPPLLRSAKLASRLAAPTSEQIAFDSGLTGTMRLFDAGRQGADTEGGHQIIALPPGRYQMRANYFQANSLAIVVREISSQQNGAAGCR